MKHITLFLTALLLTLPAMPRAVAADRPNVLWLVAEDATSTWFGCYGNTEAKTPNIDAFARQSFLYTHAFACAPVCAPSRSTWITGINAISMGTLPMRSRYNIPHDLIKYYPDYLRQAGYYTSNCTKTDYNIGGRPDTACWDDKVRDCWTKRKTGQPFFQVINYMESHESMAFGDCLHTRHAPADVTLFKYHPDELGIRMNYAKYYDAVENMDTQIGKALKALDDAGLADDTIVIFNSDHGGVMPGSKRFLFDAGVHAPLIIRIPEKFKYLWPSASPGSKIDRLVSFLDMPKTWLSLTGAQIPPIMQGRIFLGPQTEPEPPYVFSFRERMDERFDSERSVRDKHFAYIKNYMPYVIWGQHLDYMWKLLATRTWEDAYKHGRTNAVTGRFFTTKPVEELYDMDADPDNVVNLAGKPEYRQTLQTMREKLRQWQLEIHDSAMLPEAERVRRAAENKMTIYQMVRDSNLYDLPAYLDASDLALAKDPANQPHLLQLLQSPDSGVRYWGTVGLLMLGHADVNAQAALKPLLADPCGEVAAMSAWILMQSGDKVDAPKALADRLQQHSLSTLFMLNVLDWSSADLAPFVAAIHSLQRGAGAGDMPNNEKIMSAYLLQSHGLTVSPAAKQASENQKQVNAMKDWQPPS